ncbi:hypothetical protein EV132_111112 [Rhizobium sullae]|uniref:Uncharacterized protein n=1 Tax=Rhizobium sullae TaxID=50338 RepID=A0A4R3PZC8_RHISU|nr:hypothetical protein EV132_111112 [Rhizobium sullae]
MAGLELARALVTVKAHPDDFNEGANQKLAAYYRSDKQLRFREVSKQHAGWLVAAWQDPVVNDKDERFLELDVQEASAEDEND